MRLPIALCLICITATGAEVKFPPALPDGKDVVSHTTDSFLKGPGNLRPEVTVAATAPKIDFMFVPGQNYPGKPWSVWGDSLAIGGKYYTSVGDHLAPAGNAFVFEYDPANSKFRQLVNLREVLKLPEGHYTP